MSDLSINAVQALTRAQFDALTPLQQGYAAYMQAAWNKAVPDDCPYPPHSTEGEQWRSGRFAAYIEELDSSE